MTAPRPHPADLHRAELPRLRDTPAVFLTVAEATTFLRISAVTLGRWRMEGRGPPFRKFGRRVVYERADLSAWAEAQRRASTSEPDHHGAR
jgi:Helix-turn-helix domain